MRKPHRRSPAPVEPFRQRNRLTAEQLAVPCRKPGGNCHRHLLALRLARVRVGHRRQQIIHPPLAGKLIIPVHRYKQRAAALPVADKHFGDHDAVARPDPRQLTVPQLPAAGISRSHLHHRFGNMLHQTRHGSGAGHGVPLIADAPAVEDQRIESVGFGAGALRRYRHHAQLAIAVPAPVQVQRGGTAADRPAYRCQIVPLLAAQAGQPADIKRSLAVILEP